MRKILSLVAVALVVTSTISGCAASGNAANAISVPTNCTPAPQGAAAAKIELKSQPATGAPTLSFPTPLATTATVEARILKSGTGLTFGGNQQVTFEYQAIDAATGKVLQGSAWNGTDAVSQVIASGATSAGAFCEALSGQREGAIVAALMSARSSHNGQANASAGLGKNDSIIFLFKLNKVSLPRAIGDTKPAQDGFPQVVTDSKGMPGLVMQNWDASAAPTVFKEETLIQGKGAVLHDNDYVTVHYSGYIWSSSKTMFDSSWSKGTPATFQLKQDALISGFIKALVNQRVGSQVVAVLPPSEAYGKTGSGSIPGNSTLIFVIDILGKGK